MDFSTKKFLFSENETLHEGTVEQMVESDMTLPDYCPDITKILKCKIEPQVFSTTVTGDRVTIEGKAHIRLIYADENNGVCCYEQSYPFSKYFEDASVSENVTAIIKSKVEYVNCRAISARKADIRSSVVFMFKLVKKTTHEVICEADGSGIQMKKESYLVSDFCNIAEKSFSVGEVFELSTDMPSVTQIIRENAVVIPGEVKLINSKVLFKAELNINIVYSDKDGNLNMFKNSIPITQVVEIDGISEDSFAEVTTDVTSLEIQLKSDANSEMRLFDINSRVQSVAKVYSDRDFAGVSDAYSTEYDIELKRKPIKLHKRKTVINDTALYKAELDFVSTGISKIIDIWTTYIKTKTSFNENSAIIKIIATICIVYTDRDSIPSYAEREVEIEYKKPMESGKSFYFNPDCKIVEINAVVLADTKCEIKVEYILSGNVFETEIKNLITEIIMGEKKIDSKNRSAVTVYFPEINENVWDIARKYNSTVEKIKEENSLQEDKISNRCMLMITSE